MEMETIIQLKEELSSGDSSMCRLCLSSVVASKPLTQDPSDQYLVQKIFDCTSIQIMPLTGIASVVCTACKTRVEDFYLFRYQCIKNNEVLNGFSAEFSKSPLDESKSEKVVHSNEHVHQTDLFASILLEKDDPKTNDVNNINLDHTYNAKGSKKGHELDSGDDLDLLEVKLEHSDEFSFESLQEGDPLETVPKQPINAETHEDIQMSSSEKRHQYPKSPVSRKVRVLPQVNSQLLPKPMERAHTDKQPFICNICTKELKTRSSLNQHAKIHNKDEQHKCPHCSASYVDWRRLVIHLRHHTGEKPFECQVCHKAFISQQLLDGHSKIHNKDAQYQCPQCPAKFAQAGKIPIHIRTHHTGEKPFVCQICSKAFAASFQLTYHLHIHSKDKRFLCHCCSAKFSYASTLKNHIRNTHPGEIPSKIFECKTCNKFFKTLSGLLMHKRIHTNDRRYQCPHCSDKFYDSHTLKEHIRYHTGERPFVCKVCDKAFYTAAHLRTHAKIHNKDEQHQCSYCPASFAQPAQLKIHIRTHTGERPFKCQICSKAFYSSGDRNKHVKTHTKHHQQTRSTDETSSVKKSGTGTTGTGL